LGGKVRYGFKVDEILVDSGRAVGIRGAQGEARVDYVISAADGYDTVERLLGGRHKHADLGPSFAESNPPLKPYPSLIFISLGLARDWSMLPHSLIFALEPPLTFEAGALILKRLTIRFFSFDPTTAPAGKTAAVVMIETRNDQYWTRLRSEDPAAYAAEKQVTATKVIGALDCYIPGLKSSVEVVDVATPATFIRHTNNWHGSYEGWLPLAGAVLDDLSPGRSTAWTTSSWSANG
jgi:phytoene desaturase